jgi:Domain of unknown function (DUF4115)
MDFTVALILVGVGVVAILAREGYQRARAQPTARYLEALRRVHDTAHLEEAPPPGAHVTPPPPQVAAPAGDQVTPPAPVPAAPPPAPAPVPPPAIAYEPPSAPRFPAEVLRSSGAGRHQRNRVFAGGRGLLAGAVVLVIVAASGLGYALAHRGGSSPGKASVPTTAPQAAHRSNPSPTTTVAPAPPAPVVVPGAQTSGSAAYTVSSGPVQLALAASSRCWIELRAGSAVGPVVFEGILTPGASRAFENAVGLWLRLGYPPGVVLAVDGRAVGLPASASPIDVTVNSATA